MIQPAFLRCGISQGPFSFSVSSVENACLVDILCLIWVKRSAVCTMFNLLFHNYLLLLVCDFILWLFLVILSFSYMNYVTHLLDIFEVYSFSSPYDILEFKFVRNKVTIVSAGAMPPLVELLKMQNSRSMRELATAAILTLSAAAPNKPIIAASGAAPLLVQILKSGSLQGKVDAVTVLHNLSTDTEDSTELLDASAVSPLINLLKNCKKYSKFAEKATALLEILSNSEEGRTAISLVDGGILTLVETVEDGSLVSTEHAVGALLSLCRSSRDKYRELILNEGAIPGLLRLTVDGTAEAQNRARVLLDLLRDSPPEKTLTSSILEKIVFDIAERVDGVDKAPETAKRLLQDMVQRSMEHSMNCIQQRAASCNPVIPST